MFTTFYNNYGIKSVAYLYLSSIFRILIQAEITAVVAIYLNNSMNPLVNTKFKGYNYGANCYRNSNRCNDDISYFPITVSVILHLMLA